MHHVTKVKYSLQYVSLANFGKIIFENKFWYDYIPSYQIVEFPILLITSENAIKENYYQVAVQGSFKAECPSKSNS